MSNSRKPRPQHPVTAMLAPLDGARIPGGCDACDAYQVITANAYGADFHYIAVYHDEDCPVLARKRGQ